ncbi:TrmB family transcriptional regulator [Halobacteriales archaeon QS_4_69_34]|nr:MAG: TrmB family transcriptional regulator [Halobacteriales archaeon QS_4_69_34]
MPIDIETFERPDPADRSRTQAKQVFGFLAANDDKAFRRGEIAAETGIDSDAVSSILSRLEERGLVRHKRPYWAACRERRRTSAVAFGRSVDALNEHLGTEDMDEWRARAAGGPHPSERDDRSEYDDG